MAMLADLNAAERRIDAGGALKLQSSPGSSVRTALDAASQLIGKIPRA